MKQNLITYLLCTLCMALFSMAFPEKLAANEIPDAIGVNVSDTVSSTSLTVSSPDGALWIESAQESIQVPRGQTVRLTIKGSIIEAMVGSERIRGLEINLKSNAGTPLGLSTSAAVRYYAGTIEVSNKQGTLQVINRVPLEDYVASVVGSEYGFEDLEGSKAMAVVARTYALHALQNGKELLDNETFQVYRGLSHATPIARQAASETAGQVLNYDNELIDAVYSASNGGKTAYNTSLWNTKALPYLISRKDPWDEKSPHAEWDWSVSKDQLFSALSKTFGINVKDVRAGKPGYDGRITEVELRGSGTSKTISGSAFRAAIATHFGSKALKSTYFKMNDRRNSYSFSGQGFGHGVGLSQWGAHFMADDGHSYAQILAFYYSNTSLKRLPSSGSSDQPLIELPVLLKKAPVAPPVWLTSESIFERRRKSVVDALNIWDTPNKGDAKLEEGEAKNSGKRTGW